MKGHGFDIEMIEGYVLDKLSPVEKKAFEAALNKDPLLANEVEVQRDIIQSIQQFRKAELKARLNQIEVPVTSNWLSNTKIAATVFLLAAGVSSFWIFNSSQQTPKENKLVAPTQVTEQVLVEKPVISESESSDDIINSENNPVSEKITVKPVEKTRPQVKEKELVVTPPAIPDVAFDSNENLDRNISVPHGSVTPSAETKTKSVDVQTFEVKGQLKYIYYNNKLFLYGDFNDNPYEIMELNSPKGKDLFLYFNNEFYAIHPNTMKETDFVKIKDHTLKKQLNEMRSK